MDRTLTVRAFGVTINIGLPDASLLDAIEPILPPGHVPADPDAATVDFRLEPETADRFTVRQGTELIATGAGLDQAIGFLDSQIRQSIAAGSPEMVFVHAGVVADRGHGLLLPGTSYAGKTELVVALLRAGASYLSDEFAVLDQDGAVHPYPRPLSIRERGSLASRDVTAEALGAVTCSAPVRPSLIAVTHYVADADWRPAERTPADGAMFLLGHAGQGRVDPERTLHAVHLVAEQAVTLEGPRGEAEPTAEALLHRLRSLAEGEQAAGHRAGGG